MNQEYNLGTPIEDLCVICNESYSFSENVNLILSQPNTLAYAYLSYDEDSDRAGLRQKVVDMRRFINISIT